MYQYVMLFARLMGHVVSSLLLEEMRRKSME